jgi:hypothetical protein
MHDANNRFNERRAKHRTRKQAELEAELRRLEAERALQPSLKRECMARRPEWFS